MDSHEGHLDVVGGVKVWSVDTTISFNGGILGGLETSDSATWMDGMVGLRRKYSFTPEIYLTGWGLVGGGGAGYRLGCRPRHRLRIQRANISNRRVSCAGGGL